MEQQSPLPQIHPALGFVLLSVTVQTMGLQDWPDVPLKNRSVWKLRVTRRSSSSRYRPKTHNSPAGKESPPHAQTAKGRPSQRGDHGRNPTAIAEPMQAGAHRLGKTRAEPDRSESGPYHLPVGPVSHGPSVREIEATSSEVGTDLRAVRTADTALSETSPYPRSSPGIGQWVASPTFLPRTANSSLSLGNGR